MKIEQLTLESDSYEAVLRELGARALEEGYVEEPYVEALLERERAHPTGLWIEREPEPFGLAIPHADPEYVNEQAIVLGFPSETATFRSMDDRDRDVEVDVVLLLLVTDTEDYSAFLSNLTTLFQDDEFAESVLEQDGDRIVELIVDRVLEA